MTDAFVSQNSLSFTFKIIKPEKMEIYKDQSDNEYQEWFQNAKIKMTSVWEDSVLNKVKVLWYIQFLKTNSTI